MEDSQRKWNIVKKFIGIIASIIIAVLFLFASVIWSQGSGRGINMGAVAIMLFLVLESIIGFLAKNRSGVYKLSEAIEQLQQATDLIEEIHKNPSTDMYGTVKELFEVPELQDAYKEYRNENDRLYRDGESYRYCDIADYINSGLLDTIANTGFNDLVSGMLTGLGILGTFIGLIVGLANFKNGTTDEMQETINRLIEGMRVAFLTSIFGMISSLVFNWYYKSRVQKAELALENFCRAWYTCVLPRPDNEAITRVVRLQQEQRDSMEQFAESISVSLANQFDKTITPALNAITDKFGTMATQITKQQTENMQEIVLGLQGYMEKSTDNLVESVSTSISDQFEKTVMPALNAITDKFGSMSDRITEQQNSNMEVLVTGFLENLNASMGDQLARLGDSIRTICEWQEGATAAMIEVAQKITASGERLAGVNEGLEHSLSAFNSYVTRMDEVQGRLSTYFEKTITGFEGMAELSRAQSKAMSDILAGQQSYVDSVQSLDGVMDKRVKLAKEALGTQSKLLDEILTNQVAALKDDVRKIDALQQAVTESVDEVSREMKIAAGNMTASTGALAANIETTLEKTFNQFDSNLAQIVQYLSGTIQQIQETTDKVPRLYMELTSQAKEAQQKQLKTMNDALEAIRRTTGRLQADMDSLKNTGKNDRR